MQSYLNLHRRNEIVMKRKRNEVKDRYGPNAHLFVRFFLVILFFVSSVECFDIFLIYTLSLEIDAYTPLDVLAIRIVLYLVAPLFLNQRLLNSSMDVFHAISK